MTEETTHAANIFWRDIEGKTLANGTFQSCGLPRVGDWVTSTGGEHHGQVAFVNWQPRTDGAYKATVSVLVTP